MCKRLVSIRFSYRKYPLVLFLAAIGVVSLSFAEEMIVRGDPSQLPKPDLNKKIETESFGGFNREFSTKSFETKTINLPSYSGNLRASPLTEWYSPKADFYPKAIAFGDFEAKINLKKSALEKEGNQAVLHITPPSLRLDNPSLDGKEAKTPSTSIEATILPPAKNVEGEELIKLLNRGRTTSTIETGKIQVGKGFNSVTIGGTKAEPETKPPQKSEPLK